MIRFLRKAGLFLLALLCTCCSTLIPVFAETVTDNGATNYTPNRGNHGLPLHYKTVGSTPAYCLEKDVTVVISSDVYSRISFDDFSARLDSGKKLSDSEKTRIAEIAYFGYGYGNRTSKAYYAAAQDLIWQVTEGGGAFFSGVDAEKQKIEESINAYKTPHDLHILRGQEETGTSGRKASAQVPVGAIVKIEDRSGQLKNSKISSLPSNLSLCDKNGKVISASDADLSGNQFYVKVTGTGKGTIQVRKKADAGSRPCFITTSGNDQKMYVRGYVSGLDPIIGEAEITGVLIDIKIRKEDTSGNVLSGAEMELLDTKGNVKDTWTSSEKEHVVKGLILDETYTIREKNAPAGFYYFGDIKIKAEENKLYTVKDDEIHYEIIKINDKGNPVKNAELALYDETEGHKLVDMDQNPWLTDGTAKDISKYVRAGHNYKVEESDVPSKYYLSENMFFTVPEKKPDGDQTITITIQDNTINYQLAKTDQDGKPLAGARLVVRDLSDDEDPGRTIIDWLSTEQPLSVNRFERGHTYEIEETETPAHYYTSQKKSFTVPETGNADPVKVTFENERIVVSFIKKDGETGKPVPGASFELYDITDGGKRQLCDAWNSTDQPHLCEDLEKNHTYSLEEISAPAGYYKAPDQVFTIPENKPQEDLEVISVNYPVKAEVRKKDDSGKPLEGAVMELREKGNEKILDIWTTDVTGAHDISAFLSSGKTYVVTEKEVVAGYYKSVEKEFTTEEVMDHPSEMITVEMVDEAIQMQVIKKDESGNLLENAHIVLTDKTTGETADEWDTVTEAHDISGSVISGHTYVLRETECVKGHYIAAEQEFRVDDYGSGQGMITLEMIDETIRIKVRKVDESGNFLEDAHLVLIDADTGETADEWDTVKEEHDISDVVVPEKTYILRETECVGGYYISDDITFTVDKNHQDQEIRIIEMTDETICYEILKVNEKNEPIEGAHLSLKDLTDGTETGTWITGKEPIPLKGILRAGHAYELTETDHPEGVHPSAAVQFTVPEKGTAETVTIKMIDSATGIHVRKVDDAGNPVVNARLEIQDLSGNVIYAFNTDENRKGIDISEFVKGNETYILHEAGVPDGYSKAEDIRFTVTGTEKKPQVIIMTDVRIPIKVKTVETGDPGVLRYVVYLFTAVFSSLVAVFIRLKIH